MYRVPPVLALLLAVVACGEGTLDGWVLDAGPACVETTPLVDVLWVVDDSRSMCEEQIESAAGFARLAAGFGEADVRVAVTTTNVLDPTQRGRFRTDTEAASGLACQVRRMFPARPFVDPDGVVPTDPDLDCECAACAGWEAAWVARARDDGAPLPFAVPEPDVAAEQAFIACRSALGCDDPLAGRWVLEESTTPIYNENGSTNRVCRFRCAWEGDDDGAGQARCDAAFPSLDTTCRAVPGDLDASGCVRLPDTEGCPDTLPGVLPGVGPDGETTHGLAAFRCLAAPPAGPGATANLEQGLRAAWEALRPDGARADQVGRADDPALADETLTPAARRARCARRFLRPGAALVVVFLSDEDDCSVADGRTITVDDHNRCALLGDARNAPLADPEGGSDLRPLWSVEEAADRLRSVAPEPERLYVVAIVGDVLDAGSELREEQLRGAYVDSLVSGATLAANTSACTSDRGPAAWALRYIRLTERFGPRGFHVNVCADDAFADGLATAGATIAGELPRCAE